MTELFHTVQRSETAADNHISPAPCSSLMRCSDFDTGFWIRYIPHDDSLIYKMPNGLPTTLDLI